MNAILAQFILLARGNDEGWMNILILVIVAAVYGLATILKAKKGKKSQEQADEQQIRKPQRKPEGGRGALEQFVREIQRAFEPTEERESRPAAQPASKKVARPQPAPTVRKYAAEAKQVGRPKPIIPPAKPKRPGLELSIPAQQVQPDFKELPELQTKMQALPEFTTKAVERVVGKRKGMAEVPESKYLSEVLADFTDPEDLRMAILHYEILG
ncbi:unnamed protein product, partial [marine sediment metagenome]